MNQIAHRQSSGVVALPDEGRAIEVMQASLYPGARPESVQMVLGYCRARGLDPMLKPVHIVPMYVKDAVTGQGGMRDVVLPGIALYRIQAARTGCYAGKDEPEFGPDVTGQVGAATLTYPAWCKVTVHKIVGGQKVPFTAKEFWLENYATAGRDKEEPNAMWRKRAYGQLAKVAEAQALRQAFPEETGGDATAEEMEGKTFAGTTLDVRAEPAQQHRPAKTGGMVEHARQVQAERSGRSSAPAEVDIPSLDEPPEQPRDRTAMAREWVESRIPKLAALKDPAKLTRWLQDDHNKDARADIMGIDAILSQQLEIAISQACKRLGLDSDGVPFPQPGPDTAQEAVA